MNILKVLNPNRYDKIHFRQRMDMMSITYFKYKSLRTLWTANRLDKKSMAIWAYRSKVHSPLFCHSNIINFSMKLNVWSGVLILYYKELNGKFIEVVEKYNFWKDHGRMLGRHYASILFSVKLLKICGNWIYFILNENSFCISPI